jgi:hypothetical protein
VIEISHYSSRAKTKNISKQLVRCIGFWKISNI